MEHQWRLRYSEPDPNNPECPRYWYVDVGPDVHNIINHEGHEYIPTAVNMTELGLLVRLQIVAPEVGFLWVAPSSMEGNPDIIPDRRMWSVAIYEQDKAFGGREEGGWWYDTSTLVMDGIIYANVGMTPAWFNSHAEAVAYLDKMREAIVRAWLNEGNYQPGSVLCDGWYGAELHEDAMPKFYPTVRPHYE
jgi:hypothetical protein